VFAPRGYEQAMRGGGSVREEALARTRRV